MEREEIFKQIVNAIHSIAPECCSDFSKLNEDTDFVQELDFDSINYMMLASSLEEGFNVKPTDERISNILTIGDLVDYVIRHMDK